MGEKERRYQAFYTKSITIVNYMLQKLKLSETVRVLEPCAGDGVFVDAILDECPQARVTACELNEQEANKLKEKYQSNPNVKVLYTDTLLDNDLDNNVKNEGHFDIVIANPPYGAWQDYEKRKWLKREYETIFYVNETYTLFLYRCIQLLKNEGKLVFIIPDTFLNLHSHIQIRKFILNNTRIEEIDLFPSAFFPNIKFGYANLSIISLTKCADRDACLSNEVLLFKGHKKVDDLKREKNHIVQLTFRQSQILSHQAHAFFSSENANVINCLTSSDVTIGDISDCVTGFYSGNDKKYMRVKDVSLRYAKRYQVVDVDKICDEREKEIANGVQGNKVFVPIVKGGNTKYLKADDWFIDWSNTAVTHYKKDKKARYQNAQYYFKNGIAVPMVSSRSISAAFIEHRLFDQSIVGIFPKDEKWLYYLLAFFNSPTCNELIRTINPSANNSSNYIKKIPFIPPNSTQLSLVNGLIKEIIEGLRINAKYELSKESEIHNIIKEVYGF